MENLRKFRVESRSIRISGAVSAGQIALNWLTLWVKRKFSLIERQVALPKREATFVLEHFHANNREISYRRISAMQRAVSNRGLSSRAFWLDAAFCRVHSHLPLADLDFFLSKMLY